MPDASPAVNPGDGADSDETFRYAAVRPVIQIMVITWLGGLIGAAGVWAVSGVRVNVFVLGIVGFQVNAGGLMFWLTLRRSGVRVGATGLTLVGPLQSDRLVRWSDIQTARWGHILLTPRLVLRGPGVRLALPFVLDDPERFAEAVAAHAGEDHPLAMALHERMTAG